MTGPSLAGFWRALTDVLRQGVVVGSSRFWDVFANFGCEFGSIKNCAAIQSREFRDVTPICNLCAVGVARRERARTTEPDEISGKVALSQHVTTLRGGGPLAARGSGSCLSRGRRPAVRIVREHPGRSRRGEGARGRGRSGRRARPSRKNPQRGASVTRTRSSRARPESADGASTEGEGWRRGTRWRSRTARSFRD